MWKVGRTERVGVLKHDYEVSFVMFSPDGSRIFTFARGMMVWNTDDLSPFTRERVGPGGVLKHAAFSPSNRFIAFHRGWEVGVLNVSHRMASYESEKDRHMARLAHGGGGKIRWMDASRRQIVTAAGHRALVWNPSGTQHADLPHADSVRSAVFDDAGVRVVTTCEDGWIRVWDPVTRKTMFSLQAPGGSPSYAALSPDGRQIVSVSEEGLVHYWKDPSGRFPAVAFPQSRATSPNLMTCASTGEPHCFVGAATSWRAWMPKPGRGSRLSTWRPEPPSMWHPEASSMASHQSEKNILRYPGTKALRHRRSCLPGSSSFPALGAMSHQQ